MKRDAIVSLEEPAKNRSRSRERLERFHIDLGMQCECQQCELSDVCANVYESCDIDRLHHAEMLDGRADTEPYSATKLRPPREANQFLKLNEPMMQEYFARGRTVPFS
jgi:hypothetical protein